MGTAGAKPLGEVIHKLKGTGAVDIENTQLLHAFSQQRMGHRRARATGTHLHYALARHIMQVTPETFGEPQAVSVMADALAVLEHHGVDRANASGFGRQLIQQRQDCLLARVGNVQSGEVHLLRGPQQVGQGVEVQVQRLKVDQAIQVAQALGVTFLFMQCGGAGGLDTGADQAGENTRFHQAFPLSVWLKCSRARW